MLEHLIANGFAPRTVFSRSCVVVRSFSQDVEWIELGSVRRQKQEINAAWKRKYLDS